MFLELAEFNQWLLDVFFIFEVLRLVVESFHNLVLWILQVSVEQCVHQCFPLIFMQVGDEVTSHEHNAFRREKLVEAGDNHVRTCARWVLLVVSKVCQRLKYSKIKFDVWICLQNTYKCLLLMLWNQHKMIWCFAFRHRENEDRGALSLRLQLCPLPFSEHGWNKPTLSMMILIPYHWTCISVFFFKRWDLDNLS